LCILQAAARDIKIGDQEFACMAKSFATLVFFMAAKSRLLHIARAGKKKEAS